MAELQIDRVDYAAFKQRCYQVVQSGMVSELVLTSWIVTFTLNHLFKVGDTTSIDERVADMARAAQFFPSQIEKKPADKELIEKKSTDKKQRQGKRHAPKKKK